MALPEINKSNKLVFAQMLLYFAACICGFFICIPMGMTLRNFHGSCLLFSQVVWDNKVIWPWADATCEFVLYGNLAVNVIYAFLMGLVMLVILCPRVPDKHYAKLGGVDRWSLQFVMTGLNPVLVVVNVLIVLLLVCSGATLSAGLAQFCNWLIEAMGEEGVDLNGSCVNAQNLDWSRFRIRGGTSRGVRGERFVIATGMAIFFSWLSVLVWLAQCGINLYKSCRRCSCEIAEEKKKPDKSMIIAARRSRLATPVGTPGGMHTPVPLGAPMPMQQQPLMQQQMGPPHLPPHMMQHQQHQQQQQQHQQHQHQQQHQQQMYRPPQPPQQYGPPQSRGGSTSSGPPLNPQALMGPPQGRKPQHR